MTELTLIDPAPATVDNYSTWAFFDAATGLFSGASFAGLQSEMVQQLEHKGAGVVAHEGIVDHLSQRISLDTGELEHYQPDPPLDGTDPTLFDWTWNDVTRRWKRVATLKQIRAEKWDVIKAERIDRLVGNITVGGRTYQCNQAAMAGAALAAFMSTAGGTTTTFAQPWVLTDNTSANLTAEETIELGLAARDYVNGLSTTTQAMRDALDAATTAEDVAAVTWPTE